MYTYYDTPGLAEEQGVEDAGEATNGAGDQMKRVDCAGVVDPDEKT